MKSVKTSKSPKSGMSKGGWHVPKSSVGMGDYYGTGVRAKVGRVREIVGSDPISKKGLSTPPKSLA